MRDADILCDAGDVALERGRVIQAWQGLPDGNPDILHQIIDPVGMAFIHGRDAADHGGMEFDDLLQPDRTAHVLPTFWLSFITVA